MLAYHCRSMTTRIYGRPNQDRKRLKRGEPLFPRCAFTPGSVCPHGVRIGPGRVCVICHAVPPTLREEIARMPATPPLDPEVRIGREIRALTETLKAGKLWPRQKRTIEAKIARLEDELGRWIATKYRPDPGRKGGRG